MNAYVQTYIGIGIVFDRRNSKVLYLPLLYQFSVLRYGIKKTVVLHLHHIVAEHDIQLVAVEFESHRGIYLLHLKILGSRFAVGRYDALYAECLQVRNIAEVAAVCHHQLAVAAAFEDSFVRPFPDEAAEHALMAVYLVPIVFEVSQGISHGMGILTGEDRTVVVGLSGNTEQSFPTGIFRTFHVVVLHSRIEILTLHSWIEATYDIN